MIDDVSVRDDLVDCAVRAKRGSVERRVLCAALCTTGGGDLAPKLIRVAKSRMTALLTSCG